MSIRKVLGILIAVTGIVISVNGLAQEPQTLSVISPSSSTLLDNQKFDLTFTIHAANPYPVTDIKAYINGTLDVSGWAKQCFRKQSVVDIEQVTILMCPSQSGMTFGLGHNELTMKVIFMDGSIYESSSFYKVIKNLQYSILPFSFLHPSSSPSYNSNVFVSPGEKLKIIASGKIILWASNPSFPIATPRGNTTTCLATTCLIRSAPTGALLVKIGPTGRWMLANDYLQLTADRAGELIFAVNDQNTAESWADNLGAFEVIISR